MKIHDIKGPILIGTSLLAILGMIIAQTYMVFQSTQDLGNNDTNNVKGEVGLRKYFDSGSGTSTDPYVITRPIHLYNLSRLQALGVFMSSKYFQLGSTNPINGTDHFYYSDTATGTSEEISSNTYTRPYLYIPDSYSMVSIGSTATPFFGTFNGQGYNIDNLHIISDPEDIGVFGYIASGAKVSNVTFSNLSISDQGYDAASVGDFYTCGLETNSSINLLSYDSTPLTTTTSTFSDLSKTFTLDSSLIPSSLISYSDVTYAIRSTNSDLFRVSEDGKTISINTLVLTGGTDTSVTPNITYPRNDTFMNANTSASQRIYVTGSRVVNNIRYAKILSSYIITINNDITSGSPVISLSAVRDPESTMSYTHSTNIGFIAGHSDGSMENDYVYNGTFNLNSSATHTPTLVESEVGLIGELGINLDNTISPTVAYEKAGDTGIINFTDIYNNVRASQTTSTGSQTETFDKAYTYYYYDPVSGNLYDDYLRKKLSASGSEYITQYITDQPNSLDFQGRKIIAEDETKSRGLGIFKLNTADFDNSNQLNQYTYGLGEFNVTYDYSTDFNSVYYTTAELDATQGGTTTPAEFFGSGNIYSWSPTSTSHKWRINQGTTLPETTQTASFDSLTLNRLLTSRSFERNFNYLINFKLEALDSEANNYFAKTNNPFLKDYLTYKLKDKSGNAIASTSPDFGLMIQQKSGESYINTQHFYSYLKMTSASSKSIDTMVGTKADNTTETVPARTISFSIQNELGANITIIARATEDSSNYVCIYDKNLISSTDEGWYPSYSMYVPSSRTNDTSEDKMPYYFQYNNTSKDMDSLIPSSKGHNVNDTRLYAHTFFLPKGDYYLGSPSGSAGTVASKSYIYYIAAQGQNDQGNIGGRTAVNIGADAISNVDFLLYDPRQTAVSDLTRAKLAMSANFSATSGTFQIGVNASNLPLITYGSDLIKMLVHNSANKTITFYDGTTYTTDSATFIKIGNWA
ncbi:MAG: hypothetical protein LKJ88_06725 [Bacilli bacterium]|jgi:hypothetical protein|nr:hypothetical protein [Bacilli bacterium]